MFKIFTVSILLTIATLADGIILKTGQTKSYDDNLNEVTDGSIKDDGYYQMGLPRSYTRSAVGVVTDNTTGLEWQDEYEDYVDLDENVKSATWQEAKDYCSTLGLAGGGWRLPTLDELARLADYSRYYPAMDDVFTQVRTGDYYWSDTNTTDDNDAWTIHSGLSLTYSNDKRVTNYVRCVRKGEVTEPPMFSRSSDEIVIDSRSNLQWQDDDTVGNITTWIEAIDHCEELTLGGYADWRLPNINELRSIVDYTSFRPSIDTSVFQNISPYLNYFSSTQYGSGIDVFSISFDEGRQTHNGRKQSIFSRCVRGTPSSPVVTNSAFSNSAVIMYLLN